MFVNGIFFVFCSQVSSILGLRLVKKLKFSKSFLSKVVATMGHNIAKEYEGCFHSSKIIPTPKKVSK